MKFLLALRVIAILDSCPERAPCNWECYAVNVEYSTESTLYGGLFGRKEDAKCFIEKEINRKGMWFTDEFGNDYNIPPSQIKKSIIRSVLE